MAPPFLGPKLKIERAYQHLVDLERVERNFFETNSPQLDIDVDPQTGNKFAKARLNNDPPEIIHILAGELIYQLRSTLDQIAVALARMSAAKTKLKDIYFPTGDSLKGFQADLAIKLVNVDADLIKEIEKFAPYDGGDDILRAVFRLANVDKHLELIPASTSGSLALISNFKITGARSALVMEGGLHSLKEGIVISELFPHGTIEKRNPQAQLRITGRITLGNVSIYDGKPIVPFFRHLCQRVEHVRVEMERYCVATNRI